MEAVTPEFLRGPERLAALRRTALLDTPPEEAFDRLTRLAAQVLDIPVALVSLVDENRQFFKSCVGLPEPWNEQRGTPLSHSFCQHTVASREPLIITDAREHPLVKDNLAIRDLKVIAYAGFPLQTSTGEVLGTFCAIDSEPRVWTQDDIAFVREMAASAMTEIELRTTVRELEDARAEAEGAVLMLRELHAISDAALMNLHSDDLLRELLGRVAQAVEADAVAVVLDAPGEPPSLHAGTGLDPGDESVLVQLATETAEPPPTPLARSEESEASSLSTVVGVPLATPDERLGILAVGSRTQREFSDDELKLLELAAERAAHAIANARLYQRAQSDAQLLERRLVLTLQRQQAEAERAATERGRLLAHVVAAQEDERQRIAFDVHDDYLQAFTAVRMHLDTLVSELEDPAHRARAEQLQRDVAATTERMRGLVFDLRPPALDWAGVASALRLYLEETREQFGLEYVLEARIEDEPPGEVRVIAYRIAQEAITNVRKHARASTVSVLVDGRDGGFHVTVRDDGEGFAAHGGPRSSRSFGLAGMRERAEMAGGWWRIESEPGAGTTVEFWLPGAGAA